MRLLPCAPKTEGMIKAFGPWGGSLCVWGEEGDGVAGNAALNSLLCYMGLVLLGHHGQHDMLSALNMARMHALSAEVGQAY
jgi:hypothetical protein